MKTRTMLASTVMLALLLISCNVLTFRGTRAITPSDVIVTETRSVSGFDSIDFSTVGRIQLSQGDRESLTISGSDNLVPLIQTSVSGSTLNISSDANIHVTSFSDENILTFAIVVKDLTSLKISGLGDVDAGILSLPSLAVEMSGAGKVQLEQLLTDNLEINVSGLGTVEIAGQATRATVDISGAGSVNAPDLQIQTANVSVPGLGSATLWVTGQLSGSISGAGSISYYGDPQLQTNTSGLGSFKPLGNK